MATNRQLPGYSPSNRFGTATGLPRLVPALLFAVLAEQLSGFARSQSEADPATLLRLLRQQAAQRLEHRDPAIRGEAALVVATSELGNFDQSLLRIARDLDEPARVRGLLALGLRAAPGAANTLAEIMETRAHQRTATGLAAAYAIGALPTEQGSAPLIRRITAFQQGNQRQQRDLMLALLRGLRAQPDPALRTALQQLYLDESVRDPELRSALLEHLLRDAGLLASTHVERILHNAAQAEREVLLRYLAQHESAEDATLLPLLLQQAQKAELPLHRALALQALTRRRHPQALELATHATRSLHAEEFAAGIQASQQLGGALHRRRAEQILAHEEDPARLQRMLAVWSASPSTDAASRMAEIATAPAANAELRACATLALGRSDPQRAQQFAVPLFWQVQQAELLAQLSHLLPPAAMPDDTTPAAFPYALALAHQSWVLLLRQQRPDALQTLLRSFATSQLTQRQELQLLMALRRATTPIDSAHEASLPAVLAKVLVP